MNLFDVYPLFGIEPVKAQGCFLWDKNGMKYLDLYGGHAVISIGHSHPQYVKKITEQLQRIGYYSNSVKNPLQEELAHKLGEMCGYPDYQLFLCNSGAEANENALKLASFRTGRKRMIAFTKAFHGRTSLAVAATDDITIRAPVNENPCITFLPFNNIESLHDENGDDVCAVIVEGIQGVGGVNVPSAGFLHGIRRWCDRYGAVMITDEIQSGYGRTGRFFAHQTICPEKGGAVRPDIITVAKGMGNGFPVAGVLISPEIKPKHGMLGTTFGGNHLACAAAIAVLDVMKKEKLAEHAAEMGDYIFGKLSDFETIRQVRGLGLMIGIELEQPAAIIRNELLLKHKILTGSSSDKNTIRILPPLCIKKEEADVFLDAFESVLKNTCATV
ncbi:MAG TPA: aminotransferase class III-fold pyridoxal phosphate-dependent enzyme [Chitinophagales bacterium]|nr:aminotransferase class III-fold pyridoxal phosphate-dependent enzyme [Chitinophagales bacterium]